MSHLAKGITGRVLLPIAATLCLAMPVWAADCSMPVSQGDAPAIRDCVYIARASIGAVPCANCVCDADGSGDVRITDALRCLLFVVGADVSLDCPACDGTTTTTMPECASCNDVLLGAADEGELCELSRLLYDEWKRCPCGVCASECSGVCLRIASSPQFDQSACLGCWRDQCWPLLAACTDD